MSKRQPPQANRLSVQAYYARNKSTILYRKAIKRCKRSGAVPNPSSVFEHNFPVQAFFTAFAEWAGSCDDAAKIAKQKRKLKKLHQFESSIASGTSGCGVFAS